jgi:hypothetical protein
MCPWSIPGVVTDATLTLEARPSRVTVVVGPNGSEKSALGHWLERQAQPANVKRLIAPRRLWFQHAGPEITSAQLEQYEPNFRNWSMEADSRWLDHAHQQRASIILFDLLEAISQIRY